MASEPTGDDDHARVDTGGDQRPGDDERVHRPAAEGLHVAPGGVHAAGLLGDRLGEVAAAALVAVADGLLPAADHVGDVLRGEPGRPEQVLQGEGAARLAREVLQEHGGGEALVQLVRPAHGAGRLPVLVDREPAVRRGAPVELEEPEAVGLLHAPVQLGLVDDDAERAFPARFDGVAPPRAGKLPELLGPEVADQRLVRRVAERVVVGAETPGEGGEEPVRVRGQLARRLRAVPDEVGRVGEDERAGVDRRAPGHSGSTSHTVVGSTSVWSSSSARSTIRRRSGSSRPNGCVIAGPRTMRLAPTIVAIVGSEVTNTVGTPARSISFASTDPQRVPVPQVPERSTASTPASFSSAAISRPKRVEAATGVPFPVVV